jgi:ABC-type uncharacterized transport system substrate-binding protein
MLRLLAVVGFLASSLTTNALHVYIAFDAKDNPSNVSLLNNVQSYIKDSFPEATTSTIISSSFIQSNDKDQIIVSLGNESLQLLSESPPAIPIIAIFVSKVSFVEYSQSSVNSDSITAIFSDPSIIKQLALIRILYGDKTNVGYFVSDNDPYIHDVINYSQQLGLSINKLKYKNQAFKPDLLKNIDVLLLQNNKELFKYIPLDDLLYITYDLNNTGVIGYSSGLVKNGAVATTYHTLDDTLKTLKTWLLHFSETGKLLGPAYPETYQLISNKYVIRSLGLSNPSDEKIINYINRYGKQGNGL